MAGAAGRDAGTAIERLVLILAALASKPKFGLDAVKLAEAVGHKTDPSGLTALRRDVDWLRSVGWQIDNEAATGESAKYRLRAGDNRLATLLDAAERAALDEALEEMPVEPPPPHLDKLERAAERHCLAHFTYKNTRRTVHPYTLHSGPSGWVLRGREIDGTVVKSFVVSRMDEVEIEHPGTAEVVQTVPHRGWDPLTWVVDDPVEVTLHTTADHLPPVQRALPSADVTQRGPDGVTLTITVTHHSAFRTRLYDLGPRVRLLGPPDVRAEMISELETIAGRVS